MRSDLFALGMFYQAGELALGIVKRGRIYLLDARTRGSLSGESVDDLLDDWERNLAVLHGIVGSLDVKVEPAAVALSAARAPLKRPSKILCAAANYKAHVEEMRKSNYAGEYDKKKDFMGEKSRARAYLFLKAPSSLCGPYDDVVIPPGQKTDWEAEMVAVVGKRCRNVKAEQARDVIAGYMTGNDISCRTLLWREDRQTVRSDWLASKSHDSFGPIGPLFVPRDCIPDHNNLEIQLKLNGVVKQTGNTKDMIFSPDEQIEYVSAMMTLMPGDLFFTGTVSGVGQGTGESLKGGDVLECEVEGLGAQKNKIVQASEKS
jgi:2,4-didehydro-3-deoxy-L-rhamnonate hydrolase